jgi:hypothetical protein
MPTWTTIGSVCRANFDDMHAALQQDVLKRRTASSCGGSPVADAGRVQGWRMAKVVVRSRTNQGGHADALAMAFRVVESEFGRFRLA